MSNTEQSAGSTAAPAPITEVTAPTTPTWRRGLRLPNTVALLVVLAAEMIFFGIRSPYFFLWSNWTNILSNMSVVGVLACGLTLLLVAGQVDLSVGAGIGFVGLIIAEVAPAHGTAVALLLGMLTGLGIGLLNGFVVTVVGVNSLIATIGTMSIFAGLTIAIGNGSTIPISGVGWGIMRPFLQIPVTVLVFLAVAVIFGLVLAFTVYGRSFYAIGANSTAARLVGIRVPRLLFTGFAVSGLCIALGGLISTSLVGSTSGTTGTGLEIAAVTAVILGGTPLSGGSGSIIGTLIGLLVVQILGNGLTLINVQSSWQQVATGALLILAVSFDQLRRRFVREG